MCGLTVPSGNNSALSSDQKRGGSLGAGRKIIVRVTFIVLSALMSRITKGVHDWYEFDNFVLEIIMLL